jgi:hypothetical protein
MLRNTVNDGPTELIMKKPKIETHKIRSNLADGHTLAPLSSRAFVSSLPEGAYSRRRNDIAQLDPKVFEPFKNNVGKPPRKVIINRKIKEFNDVDITTELKRHGIDFTNTDSVISNEAHLKLEWFDDSSYEVRPPKEMICLVNKNNNLAKLPD